MFHHTTVLLLPTVLIFLFTKFDMKLIVSQRGTKLSGLILFCVKTTRPFILNHNSVHVPNALGPDIN